MQPPKTNSTTPCNAQLVSYDFHMHCCQGCFTQETAIRFALCGRCKHVRYCTVECQKVDWVRHKTFCSDKSEEKSELEYVEHERKHYVGLHAAKISKRTREFRVLAENEREIAQGLSCQAENFRKSLYEISLGALIKFDRYKSKNDPEASQKLKNIFYAHLDCFLTSFIPSLLVQYPLKQNMNKNQKYLIETSSDLQYFLPRMERSLGRGVSLPIKNTLQLAQQFMELSAAKGSLFLNKGYPSHVESALQDLRKICIDILTELISSEKQKKPNDFLMVWVYEKVCSFSCIAPDNFDRFILGVKNKDSNLMISSLHFVPILEEVANAYKTYAEEKPDFTETHLRDVVRSITSGACFALCKRIIKSSADSQRLILCAKGRLGPESIAVVIENLDKHSNTHSDVVGFGRYFTVLISHMFCTTISPSLVIKSANK